MKYCIIYAQPNILTGEKISLGLVCLTDDGCFFKYSDFRLKVAKRLLTQGQGEYVDYIVKDFRRAYLDGRDNAAILGSLNTLHRYSNSYVIFSNVIEISIPPSLMSPEKLYSELIEDASGKFNMETSR